jgi:CRP/FNR family transcriptional regulator, anaerobic regulatory protein
VQEGDRAEYIYKVTSGALRAVRLLPDGRRYIANFLMPGDFVGLTEGESYGHSIEAISDAGLLRYARSSFESLLDRDPRAGRRFFGVMCKELTAVQDRLLLLGRKTATERLASFLLAMADRKARANGGNGQGRVELPMNRSDMADYLGLRIETICRLLTDLKSRRIIDLPDIHSVVLLRRDELEELSEGGA